MISDSEPGHVVILDDVNGIQTAVTADSDMANKDFTVGCDTITLLPLAIDREWMGLP